MSEYTSSEADFASSASVYESVSPERSPSPSSRMREETTDATVTHDEEEDLSQSEEPVMYKDSSGEFFTEYW